MTKAPKGENFKRTTILAGANAYPQRGVVEAVVKADKADPLASTPWSEVGNIRLTCAIWHKKVRRFGKFRPCRKCRAKIRAIEEEA